MNRIGRAMRMVVVAAAALVLARPGVAEAQVGVSFWLGVGEASDSGASTFGTEAKQVSAHVALPVFPVSVRGDVLLLGDGVSLDGLSYSLNTLFRLTLPVVQPYAIAGFGRYALTKDIDESGWNAGAGARLGFGRLGVFVEIRRHFPLERTITVFGLTM
jgi:hypothetical protein